LNLRPLGYEPRTTRLTDHRPPRQSQSGGRIERGTVSRVVMSRGPLRRVLVTVLVTTGRSNRAPTARVACRRAEHLELAQEAPRLVTANSSAASPGHLGRSTGSHGAILAGWVRPGRSPRPTCETRSREIMDAVDHGQSFTVTRDGHRFGELIPLRQRPPVRLPAVTSAPCHARLPMSSGTRFPPIRTRHATIRPAARMSAEQPQPAKAQHQHHDRSHGQRRAATPITHQHHHFAGLDPLIPSSPWTRRYARHHGWQRRSGVAR
jgi:antitoxin (DNA-binding transcriptional repressor) of toxin-antitoxin stability system